MITKTFTSEQSKDILEISYFAKSRNASFNLKQFDSVSENIKLLGELIEYLKLNDIKWIITNLDFRFKVPENDPVRWCPVRHCHMKGQTPSFFFQTIERPSKEE